MFSSEAEQKLSIDTKDFDLLTLTLKFDLLFKEILTLVISFEW
jgi:hypothetical protein